VTTTWVGGCFDNSLVGSSAPLTSSPCLVELGGDCDWLPDAALLLAATTTSAACPRDNYERLEFLGDSFLKVRSPLTPPAHPTKFSPLFISYLPHSSGMQHPNEHVTVSPKSSDTAQINSSPTLKEIVQLLNKFWTYVSFPSNSHLGTMFQFAFNSCALWHIPTHTPYGP
jgi:hypothetical protein